jgi:hypothetical protein
MWCFDLKCTVHKDFFDNNCRLCRDEYLDMMGTDDSPDGSPRQSKHYKELTEERAKQLYQEVMLQYLKSGMSENDSSSRAKAVVRKQCDLRGISHWSWL